MKVGSLFTGIGGFDLGFERAGMEIAWQCENDRHARAVLKRHWPGVPCFEDVRSIDTTTPRVDLICGGFPCQDVSVAGRRAGLAGERSGLWFEFARVLSQLRPEWVVIENVPGLRSSQRGRDFATIVRGLAQRGYLGVWLSPDAQYFGLAQRRERVFLVGHRGDGRAVEVLPQPESVCGDPPSRRAPWESVTAPLGGSAQSGGYRTTDLDHGAIIIGGLTSSLGHHGHGSPRGDGTDPIVFDRQQVTSPTNRSQPAPGRPTGALGVEAPLLAYAQELADPLTAVSGRTTSAAGNNPRPLNVVLANRPRRLTPTECERLQGFPNGWTAAQSDSHRYRQLGNAVAVPVAEWIGRRIMEVSA